MDRWEHGSDFHWTSVEGGARAVAPWGDRAAWLATGRDALRSLVDHLGARCRRVWLPSYYCEDVVSCLAGASVEVLRYPDHPLVSFAAPPDLGPQDALLLVNFFGLRQAPVVMTRAVVVEDHTHDPWSSWASGSRADFCFASLRKTLPVPDGAVVWSPLGRALPAPVPLIGARRLAVADRLAGMRLKARYLAGEEVDKPHFRDLLVRAERALASGPVSGASEGSLAAIEAFPTATWRDRRASNFVALSGALQACRGLTLLAPKRGCVPFAVTAVCGSAEGRDRLRSALVSERIYTAVLWAQRACRAGASAVEEEGVDLSRRVLSFHCDGRYSSRDLARVASLVIARMGGT